MRIQLTTWQRAGLIMAVSQARGNVGVLRLGLEALEALEWTEEEREEIGYREVGGRAEWNEAGADRVWEVDLGEKAARFVAGVVEGFGGWPVARAEEVFRLIEELRREGDE